MDANGARALAERIAQQEHWRQAAAVRDGRQDASDPDAETLVMIGHGVRLYRGETHEELRDGRVTKVVTHLRKMLVDDRWETSVVSDADFAAQSA